MTVNRWFDKNGKKKRISKDVEKFREFAYENKDIFQGKFLLIIVKRVKAKWSLSLYDALDLTNYIIGVYNNKGPFSIERYKRGEKLAKTL